MSNSPMPPGDDLASPGHFGWSKGVAFLAAIGRFVRDKPQTALVILAGGFVCLYAVWVLVFVHSFPDIGLRCTLSPKVNRVNPDYLRSAEGNWPPREGDVIVELGNEGIEHWPELLKTLIALRQLAAPSPGQPPTYVDRDGEHWVLVKLQRPEDGSLISGWCLLGEPPLRALVPSIVWFLLNSVLLTVAALVFWKRPADRAATQFFWLSIVTVAAYMGGYHWSRIVTHGPLFLIYTMCGVLLPAVSLHFYLIFPRPKAFLGTYGRRIWLVVYGIPLIFLAALVGSYLYVRVLIRTGSPPETVEVIHHIIVGITYVYLGVAGCWYLASVICMAHSYWMAGDPRERSQVTWILVGAFLAMVPTSYSFYLLNWQPDDFGRGAATWPMFAASIVYTAAFTISITRYRQLDPIIGSSVIYFLYSFLFGLVYYALVFAGMLILGGQLIERPLLGQALWVSSTALVLLIILNLVRSRIKKVLDRRFYREKYQLDRTLQRMGQAIDQLVDPPTLARRLLQTSTELLNVSRGAIYLREGEPPFFRLAGTIGAPPPLAELAPGCPLVDVLQTRGTLSLRSGRWAAADPAAGQLRFLGGEAAQALAHEGKLLALLLLGPKDLGPYGPEDLNLLAAFAQMTALALESAEGHRTIELLNRDLQTKVEKISEQQRRILALQTQLTQVTAIREQAAALRESGNGSHPPGTGGGDAAARPPLALPGAGILGSSPAVRRLLQMVRKVSASPSAVLIRGESGTGKELLAQALHDHSARAGQAFVKVHCAALSAGLLESELFGHVKGAFTGAHRDKVGRFELANGGTLFLDEIGDISPEVQTKLLRVLQDHTFERVGSSEPLRVDVRLIAATHQDLERLIREGRFRSDLYYRLNVISIAVPPLRDRREDIAELALHFLRLFAQRCGKHVSAIEDDALALLKGYSWPGNIRELENFLQRAVVMAEGMTVTARDLPPELTRELDDHVEVPSAPGNGNGDEAKVLVVGKGIQAEHDERDRRERERLVRALAAAAGNKAEAARALGLARSTLVSRLKKHGLS